MRLRALSLLISVAILASLFPSLADTPLQAFENGNRLYELGQFDEAIEQYEKLVHEKKVSAPLFFNLGNAHFKAGHLGEAIRWFRLAERLAPRDPDIQANLSFARSQVQGSPSISVPRWKRALQRFTLNELTAVTCLAVWIWFALLIIRQIRPAWKPNLRAATRIAGLAAVALGCVLGLAAHDRLGSHPAVVILPEATARYGPLEESQTAFTLKDGAEVQVRDSKGNWRRVRDGAGRLGWVPADAIAPIGLNELGST